MLEEGEAKLEPEEEKAFDEFCALIKKRLMEGRKKYGMDYKTKDLFKEIEFELLDVPGYAFLQFMKMRKLSNDFDRAVRKEGPNNTGPQS